MPVHHSKKIAGIPLRKYLSIWSAVASIEHTTLPYRENVFQRRLEQVPELFLSNKLEK